MGLTPEEQQGITVNDHLDFLNERVDLTPAPAGGAAPAPSAPATSTGADVAGAAPTSAPAGPPAPPADGPGSAEYARFQADQAEFRRWQAAQKREEEERRRRAEEWKEGEHYVSDHLSSGRHDLPQVDVKPQAGGELAEPTVAS